MLIYAHYYYFHFISLFITAIIFARFSLLHYCFHIIFIIFFLLSLSSFRRYQYLLLLLLLFIFIIDDLHNFRRLFHYYVAIIIIISIFIIFISLRLFHYYYYFADSHITLILLHYYFSTRRHYHHYHHVFSFYAITLLRFIISPFDIFMAVITFRQYCQYYRFFLHFFHALFIISFHYDFDTDFAIIFTRYTDATHFISIPHIIAFIIDYWLISIFSIFISLFHFIIISSSLRDYFDGFSLLLSDYSHLFIADYAAIALRHFIIIIDHYCHQLLISFHYCHYWHAAFFTMRFMMPLFSHITLTLLLSFSFDSASLRHHYYFLFSIFTLTYHSHYYYFHYHYFRCYYFHYAHLCHWIMPPLPPFSYFFIITLHILISQPSFYYCHFRLLDFPSYVHYRSRRHLRHIIAAIIIIIIAIDLLSFHTRYLFLSFSSLIYYYCYAVIFSPLFIIIIFSIFRRL